ncbi:MAG: hypothetical protein H6R19_772 [Proteobacteria bacterium]|nr:hypothetical protein [Pseudomonadota bacterium]
MNRLVYLLYALIVTTVVTGVNHSLTSSSGSYRSWGNSSGFSTGSGSGWSGSGHK